MDRSGVMTPQGFLFLIGDSAFLVQNDSLEEQMMFGDPDDYLAERKTPIVIGNSLYYVYNGMVVKSPVSDLSSGETTPSPSAGGPLIDFLFYDGKTLYALDCMDQMGYDVDPDTLECRSFVFPYEFSASGSWGANIFVRDGAFYYKTYSDDDDSGFWRFTPETGETIPLFQNKDYTYIDDVCMDQAGNFYFIGSRKGVDDFLEDSGSVDGGYGRTAVYTLPANGGEAVKLLDLREHPYFLSKNHHLRGYNPFGLRVYGEYIYFLSPLAQTREDADDYELLRMRLDGSKLQGVRLFEQPMGSGWSMVDDWLVAGGGGNLAVLRTKGDAFVLELNPYGKSRGAIGISWEDIPEQ